MIDEQKPPNVNTPPSAETAIKNHGSSLTIAIHMEDGHPLRASDFAKHMTATITVLRSIDKTMHGRVTTEWYIKAFDIQMNGVAYQIVGFPKGQAIRMTGVNQNGPDLVNWKPAGRTPSEAPSS